MFFNSCHVLQFFIVQGIFEYNLWQYLLPVISADNIWKQWEQMVVAQEILALTGGGKTREYTETRPDGSTVTYTIDVEEEEYEVILQEGDIQRDLANVLQEEVEITTTRTVKTMEYMMEGQGGGRTMEIIREGGRGGEMAITRSSATISGAGEGGEMTKTKSGGSMVSPPWKMQN